VEIRLFAYGTLLVPEVMEIVTGRGFASEPARLADHRCRLLRGAVYPGVLPVRGETTQGRVHHGLDARALERTDRFEGALYERRALEVTLARGTGCEAFVYVLRSEHRALATDARFDLAAFREHHLRDYLAACRAFVRELSDEAAG